jgi:hypothetical protein
VDVEIRPEPSPEERRALLAVLDELLAEPERPAPYRSAWRELGILENAEPEGDYETVALPRSSPGAIRA